MLSRYNIAEWDWQHWGCVTTAACGVSGDQCSPSRPYKDP